MNGERSASPPPHSCVPGAYVLLTALLLLLLAGATACAGPKPSARATPEKKMATVTQSPEQFFARRPAGEPFELRVGGATHQSFWKKAACAYSEWSFGSRENGNLASFSVGEKKGEALLLIDEGNDATVPVRELRLYLQPAFERTLAKGQSDLPEELQQLVEQGEINYLAEYCLEPGRTYHAMFREERYPLPPAGPGGQPRESTNKVLVLSDRPFVDGKPQGEPIPSYRNWTY